MTLRSLLYVPGNRPALFAKALAGDADAVIVDWEDAVPPAERSGAREATTDWLRAGGGAAKPVLIRVNAGEAGLGKVEALVRSGAVVAGLLVPKAESGPALARVHAILDGDGPRLADVALQPIVESIAGLYALAELAAASQRVARFSFGAGDFVADLGGVSTPERIETLAARSEGAMRSRLLGLVAPLAHVFTPITDLAGLRCACLEDRAPGYGARSCIHPAQIATVNAAFGASESELRTARAIVARFGTEQAAGSGAFQMSDGTFVDKAVVRRARDAGAGLCLVPRRRGALASPLRGRTEAAEWFILAGSRRLHASNGRHQRILPTSAGSMPLDISRTSRRTPHLRRDTLR